MYKLYYQLIEILKLPKSEVNKVLEVGPGLGILKTMLSNYSYEYVSLDIDESNKPGINADVRKIPLAESSVDLICAFQILEHLPYEDFIKALAEISRVSRRYIYISLPCNTSSVRFCFALKNNLRFLNRLSFKIEKLSVFNMWPKKDKDEAELLRRPDKKNPHYWEVGTKSFPKKRIIEAIESLGLRVLKDFHNPYNPYHWHILMKKQK